MVSVKLYRGGGIAHEDRANRALDYAQKGARKEVSDNRANASNKKERERCQ